MFYGWHRPSPDHAYVIAMATSYNGLVIGVFRNHLVGHGVNRNHLFFSEPPLDSELRPWACHTHHPILFSTFCRFIAKLGTTGFPYVWLGLWEGYKDFYCLIVKGKSRGSGASSKTRECSTGIFLEECISSDWTKVRKRYLTLTGHVFFQFRATLSAHTTCGNSFGCCDFALSAIAANLRSAVARLPSSTKIISMHAQMMSYWMSPGNIRV